MTVPNTVARSRWWPLFRPGARHAVGAGHALRAPLLATGPQVQVVGEQATHQLAGALGELVLELGMGQLAATRIGKPGHHLLEQLPGPVERPRHTLHLLRLPRLGLLPVP
ncbi:MAG: hypothetical protein ACRDT0_10975 [Pseudonocardiaceae bacterium]